MILSLLLACGGPPSSSPSSASLDDTAPDVADQEDETYEIPDFPAGVSTLAGSGDMAIADGTGTSASFLEPKAIALSPDGLLYVAGTGGRLRTVDMDGVVRTITSSNRALDDVGGLAVDAEGAVYLSDPQQHCIYRVADGDPEVIAGSCGTSGFEDGVAPLFKRPRDLEFDADGRLLVADSENMRIRAIEPDGSASTVAGHDSYGVSTEGPATEAALYFPLALAVHADGSVFFSGLDNCIRRVADGVVEDVAGLCNNYSSSGTEDGVADEARFFGPYGLALDGDGELLIADAFNLRIRSLGSDLAEVDTVTGSSKGYLDGTLEEALFDVPRDVAIDRDGNLFVTDSVNHRIRVVVR